MRDTTHDPDCRTYPVRRRRSRYRHCRASGHGWRACGGGTAAIDLSISAAPVDPERINIFECWRDQAALYGWCKVANPPDVERRETIVKLYRADKAEEPF